MIGLAPLNYTSWLAQVTPVGFILPSILGECSEVFRTGRTESVAVLTVDILQVLAVLFSH